MSNTSIDSVLNETRSFPPPAAFSQHAHVKSMAEYEALAQRAHANPDAFWAEIAGELVWSKHWSKMLD